MKKRYNITLDESTYEEFKQYVDNVSGFLNSVIRRYVSFQKHKQDSEANDKSKKLIALKPPWPQMTGGKGKGKRRMILTILLSLENSSQWNSQT